MGFTPIGKLLLSGLLAGGACCPKAQTSEPAQRPVIPVDTVDYLARALIEFEQAVFYKPRDGAIGGFEVELAPLLVQQVIGSDGEPAGRGGFGRAVATLPTIFAGTSKVALAGREHQQVRYLWWYSSVDVRGVRVTLASDGFPWIWEVLSGDTDVDLVFVSESLERASAEVFGLPLPGRRYSVERGLDEAPRTVVARVIDDGPMPMGPVVYLTSPAHRISTVTCRCMASQVTRFVSTVYYDLQPLGLLRAEGPSSRRFFGSHARAGVTVVPAVSSGGLDDAERFLEQWQARPLERRLRLPVEGRARNTADATTKRQNAETSRACCFDVSTF